MIQAQATMTTQMPVRLLNLLAPSIACTAKQANHDALL